MTYAERKCKECWEKLETCAICKTEIFENKKFICLTDLQIRVCFTHISEFDEFIGGYHCCSKECYIDYIKSWPTATFIWACGNYHNFKNPGKYETKKEAEECCKEGHLK